MVIYPLNMVIFRFAFCMFTRPGSRRHNGKLRMSQGFLGSMDVPGNNWTVVARWAPGGLTSWPNGIPSGFQMGFQMGFQVDSQFLNLRSSTFDCPFLFDPILSLPHELQRSGVFHTAGGESVYVPFFLAVRRRRNWWVMGWSKNWFRTCGF